MPENPTNPSPSNFFSEFEIFSSLELLVGFAIICISIGFLKSDDVAAAVGRGVNNAVALVVLLVDDMITGIESLGTSPRTHQVLSVVQWLMFKFVASTGKNVVLACSSVDISRRVRSAVPTLKRGMFVFVEGVRLLVGHARDFFVFGLMLAAIALHAMVNYLHAWIVTTDFTAIIIDIGEFILKAILDSYNLLYSISAILGIYFSSAEQWFTTRIFTPALSTDFLHLIWTPFETATIWFWSTCEALGVFVPFRSMAGQLEGAFEMVFGTGDVAGRRTFGDLMAPPVVPPSTPRGPVEVADGEYQSPWKDRLRKRSVSTTRY